MGHSKMWRVSSATILAQFVYMAIILATVRRPSDAWIVPLAVTTSAIVTAFVLLNRARADFNIGMPHYMPGEWGTFLPICVTLGIASMMSMIYDQIDTVMLRYLRTEAEVGLYVASYRLMAISMSFLSVLVQVFYPLFSGSAKGDETKNKQYVQWMANNTIALALPIAAGGFLLAKPICALVMGARYSGADHLLRWLMLNLLSASAAVLFSSRLIPSNRERQYLWSVAAGALANIVLNFIFIPRYGAIAAVFTTITAQTTVAACAFYFTRDLHRANLVRPVAISLLASGIMAAAIIGTERVANLHVMILIVGGAAIYGVTMFAALRVWKQPVGVGGQE
jgi:O-antigen/teichoic acid export membrane protein